MNYSTFSKVLRMSLILACLTSLDASESSAQAPAKPSPKENAAALEHAQKGQDLYKAGKAKEAIIELKKAVELSPRNADIRNQLATAYYFDKQMPQMWYELRQGARIDPGHQLIAKGLLSYWNAMDQQGLFNVGTSETLVTKSLGKPDTAMKAPNDGSRSRLIYGFLAADFRDQKLHQTLDLRGLKGQHFMSQEIIDVQLDGRGWVPAYRTNNRNSATTEYTLPSEKIQKWTELFSIQRLHNLAKDSKPIEQVAIGMMENLKKTNPQRKYQIIEKDNASVLFEWHSPSTKTHPAQHEIVRLFKAGRDVHRIAYVHKTDKFNEETRSRWVKIFKNAKLKSVKSMPETSSKPKSDTPKLRNTKPANDQNMWQFGRLISVAAYAHARQQRDLARKNLLSAVRLSSDVGFRMPPPFQLTEDESKNIAMAIDYLLTKIPDAMREQKFAGEKIATYEVITRTFALAMLASDESLSEKSMVGITKAIEKSALPNSLIAALRENKDATPDQIRKMIQKLHADVENYFETQAKNEK